MYIVVPFLAKLLRLVIVLVVAIPIVNGSVTRSENGQKRGLMRKRGRSI